MLLSISARVYFEVTNKSKLQPLNILELSKLSNVFTSPEPVENTFTRVSYKCLTGTLLIFTSKFLCVFMPVFLC